MFDKVFEYAGTHKKGTISATLLILLSVTLGVIPFYLAFQIIDPLVKGNIITGHYVGIRLLWILILLILKALLYGLGLSVSHKAAYGTLYNIRIYLQGKMENLPLGVIQKNGTGLLKKLFVDDIDNLELLLAHALPEGIGNLMVPIIVYIVMFIIDWKLAILSLVSIPLSIIAMRKMYSIGTLKMKDYYSSAQVMNNTIIEYINGMEVVKVFNKVGESYQRFSGDVKSYRDLTLNWYKACWPWMAIYNSLLPCIVILTLPLGAWFVLQGICDLSHFILILCLSFSIGVPLLKTMGFLPIIPQIKHKIMALEGVMQSEPLKQSNEAFKGKNYGVEYKNVTFAYEEEEVIKDVSFTMNPNKITALVGESGSGKSTLAKLLIHYYDIKSGEILIGGQDITKMSLVELNNQISYVGQENYLFNISILENIRIGKPNATDAEVMDAARKAECMEFVNKLSKGINTLVGESGDALSGGQKQRIVLARAILKDSPIVVLDEATAFIDPENEDKIHNAIKRLVKDKTLLVIAHKLNSIKDADTICVLNRGRLEKVGTHEQLLKKSPTYNKLWKVQQKAAMWNPKELEVEE